MAIPMSPKKLIAETFRAFFVLLLVTTSGIAGMLSDTFIDPGDGYLDMSNWLLDKEGLLPVPIVITEPAVGYGGGLAAVYFHDKPGAQKGDSPKCVGWWWERPPKMGPGLSAVGNLGIWAQDNIRYTGGLGTGLVAMDYYGLSGTDGRGENQGVSFETEALFLMQELQFRLLDSDFFAGVGYTLVDTSNAFELSPAIPDPPVCPASSLTAVQQQ